MPLSPTRPIRSVVVAGSLLAMLLLPSGVRAQAPGEVATLLAHSWNALRTGSAELAVETADAVLRQIEGTGGSDAWADQAHLARSAGLYALGRTREAAQAARSVAELDNTLEKIDDSALPGGFPAWVKAAVRNAGASMRTPEIALSELNPEREIREVATHFELDVEIVRIPVIVENADDEFVGGLDRAHFSVVDGEPPAEPVYQVISENEPSSVGILIDASDEARSETPALLQSVMQLIGQLKEEDEVFLLQFGDEPVFLSDFSSDSDALLAALADFEAGGARTVRDGLATGLIRMRDARWDKKSLVLISFGEDSGSETTAADVRRAAQRDGVSIHSILLPAQLDRWRPGQEDDAPTFLLQRLSFETGGLVALRPESAERYGGLSGWIDLAARDVGSYIRHQYLLQFESVNPPPPGQWRPLRVLVDEGDRELHIERVRARSGYVR